MSTHIVSVDAQVPAAFAQEQIEPIVSLYVHSKPVSTTHVVEQPRSPSWIFWKSSHYSPSSITPFPHSGGGDGAGGGDGGGDGGGLGGGAGGAGGG